LLTEGKVTEAIKVVRRSEGLELRAAKVRIDAHLAQEPMLRVQIETQRQATRRKFFFWFLLVDLGVTAAVIYWLVT
jgi:hypothetical protein